MDIAQTHVWCSSSSFFTYESKLLYSAACSTGVQIHSQPSVLFKKIIHPKINNSVFIQSPSCCSNLYDSYAKQRVCVCVCFLTEEKSHDDKTLVFR